MGLKDAVRHELIGNKVEITDSKNKSLIGLSGKVIDETRNTLTLETKDKIKKVIKSQVKFKMKCNDKMIEIDGKLIVSRPEDRIKRIRKI
ncbi:ribonuclease P protein subunit [Candidatus Woesearchaeota archaeon]|nr:ribonuclease P protein subunit [Candidatus Woesearchaeota archaeon]